MEKIAVVARSFQAGTGQGGKPFDKEIFERLVASPISRLLKAEVIQNIIVVVNTEPGNKLAEIVSNGVSPTKQALADRFPAETGPNRMIVTECEDWGPNPGSALALNKGMEIAKNMPGIKWLLNWSPEIEMDGSLIELGLAHAERYNLSVAGFLRQSWWEKPQWHVAQNTACLWDIATLAAVNGFATECNGTGRVIETAEYGDVPLAGMEDFHAMLRMLKKNGILRWGMVGRAEPLFWDTDFPADSERLVNHLKKIARQDQVMQAWTNDIFPKMTFKKVMDKLFSTCYFD